MHFFKTNPELRELEKKYLSRIGRLIELNEKITAEDLTIKRIKKGGGLAPLVFTDLPEGKRKEIEKLLNEQWLEGYKCAKKKFKKKDKD